MNTYRIISFVLCMVMVCTLTACSEKPNGSSEQETYLGYEEPQGNQQNAGNNSQSEGDKVPLPTRTFETMSEVRAFFERVNSASGSQTEVNGIKDITDYLTQAEANAICIEASTLLFPVLKISDEGVEFGATWTPHVKELDMIYIIDDVRYRFRYYFFNDAEWHCDEPDAPDVQVGPYTVDFQLWEHQKFDTFFFGAIEIQSDYVAFWALGNGIERPSFEAFDFVPLSSID